MSLFRQSNDEHLDSLIDRVVEDMEMYGPDSEEYSKLLKHLKALNKLKASKKRKRVSPDLVVGGLFNLLGILLIVAYEERHVITSKAPSMTQKFKL